MRLNNLIYRTSKLDAQHVAQTFIRGEEGNLGLLRQKAEENIYSSLQRLAAGLAKQTLLIKPNEQNLSPFSA